ncbi:hypothetical protein [Cryobacterium sp. TMS1-13-1]|uniref:hypothetical protein n=1 Tax=Cryobacterium sp. TMS1-13-1 TaxID=1259220 RepID=UPI00106C5BDF|nr:hypothetical protein [Cryobacterium sp. TMS1-13-1]TFD21641.1 hypothetical protein E3T31_12800 [Cryobacterium sp. TMS1-13-1]
MAHPSRATETEDSAVPTSAPIPQRMPAQFGAGAATPNISRSSATVQSVLAVAGAGLFAISAIVFTFFNPDLRDHALRSVIVGLVTLLFLGASWLLAQIGFIEFTSTTQYWLTITAVLTAVAVLALLTTRQLAKIFWSAVTGAAAMAAAVSLPFALDLGAHGAGEWYQAVAPAAGAAALLVLQALAPRAHALDRRAFLGGVLAVAGVSVLVPVLSAVLIGAVTVLTSLTGSD